MRLPSPLVLATGNPGKQRELRELLAPFVEVRTPALASPEETADTYEGNAAIKALAAARATGLPALGDDVGLEVEALGGAPGPHTRRWAEERGGWEAARRALGHHAGSRAVFYCALALALPDGTVRAALGAVRGRVVPPRGPGAGLEPCFVPDGAAAPLSELTDRGLHHRVRALEALLRLER